MIMNEQVRLKPCPFCGGKAELHTNPWSIVMCTECHATASYFLHKAEYCSADKAIEAWNRRVNNQDD